MDEIKRLHDLSGKPEGETMGMDDEKSEKTKAR